MMMGPGLRKFALTAHVVSSVGWLGTVLAFLALSIVGVASDDPERVRGIYLAAEPLAWFAIVPLSLAAFVTGVVQGIGSQWGLFRYYWVVVKFGLTVFAIVILLQYLATVASVTEVARDPSAGIDDVRSASYVLHAGVGLALLVVTTVLSIYKPRGLTPYGYRQLEKQRG